MEKRFYIKELTQDGLMKEPGELGPYFNRESFNDWNGHDTEEDAVQQIEKLKKSYTYEVTGKYAIIPVYIP